MTARTFSTVEGASDKPGKTRISDHTVTVDRVTVSTPEPTQPVDPADAVDPADVGIRLFRLEEATLAWGRGLDSIDPSAESFNIKQVEAQVRGLGVAPSRLFLAGSGEQDLVFPTLPFDAVPSQKAAQWWLTWMSVKPLPDDRGWLPIPQRLTATRRQWKDHDVDLDPQCLDGHWLLTVAASLALTAPYDIVKQALDVGLRPAGVPALRLAARHLSAAERAKLMHGRPDSGEPLEQLLLSSLLADPDEHLALVDQAPDDVLKVPTAYGRFFSYSALIAVLSGLPDQNEARRVAQRLAQPGPYDRLLPYEVPGYLGVVGADALTVIADMTNNEPVTSAACVEMAASRVHGPGAVPTMVRFSHTTKAAQQAKDWLVAHPAALAAVPDAFTGEAAGVVEQAVREVRGQAPDAFGATVVNPTVARVLATLTAEDDIPRLVDGTEPDWWVQAVAAEQEAPEVKTLKALPRYATPTALPPVQVEEGRLTPAMVEALVWSAVRSSVEMIARPLVAAARDRMPLVERDRLAVALLDGWLVGASPKERAIFLASGFLGSDGFVQRLVPLVRDWPGQSQHKRAVLGLDVLVATGRESALQGIAGIAGKSKFKGVQEAAKRAMEQLAAQAGLTTDQLADRLVPDGGLDARGTRVLTYGPRSFQLSLSPAGKLVVRQLDADGRPTGTRRTSLPAPNRKDDAALAAEAKAQLTVARKQLTDLAKVQTLRLEQAMVSGRVWAGADHREYLVGNPLLNSLIRPLVWQVTEAGQTTLVRTTEDREYLTVDDDVMTPADDAHISLAHPLNLTETEIAVWHERLTSYDLISPIEQLDRPVHRLPAGHRGPMLDAALLPQGKINPLSLVGILDKHGWRRGNPADAGAVNYCWLPFPGFDRAVVIELDGGLWTGMIGDSGDQQITSAQVTTPAKAAEIWYAGNLKPRFKWDTVDPRIVSETLRTFEALAEKMA